MNVFKILVMACTVCVGGPLATFIVILPFVVLTGCGHEESPQQKAPTDYKYFECDVTDGDPGITSLALGNRFTIAMSEETKDIFVPSLGGHPRRGGPYDAVYDSGRKPDFGEVFIKFQEIVNHGEDNDFWDFNMNRVSGDIDIKLTTYLKGVKQIPRIAHGKCGEAKRKI